MASRDFRSRQGDGRRTPSVPPIMVAAQVQSRSPMARHLTELFVLYGPCAFVPPRTLLHINQPTDAGPRWTVAVVNASTKARRRDKKEAPCGASPVRFCSAIQLFFPPTSIFWQTFSVTRSTGLATFLRA